jgi:hypothetical protein
MQDESGAFQSIVINPQVVSNNITREWVNASYMSVRGTIEVDWLYENGVSSHFTIFYPLTSFFLAITHLPVPSYLVVFYMKKEILYEHYNPTQYHSRGAPPLF